MKKLLLLSICVICSLSLMSQSYYYLRFPTAGQNPKGLNTDADYPVGGGKQSGWKVILNGPKTTPEWTAAQTIPFIFEFNGEVVNSFKVSSTGVLTFTDTVSAVPPEENEMLPSTLIPNNSICVWGLYARSEDKIITKTFIHETNKQLWIEFNSFSDRSLVEGWTYWSIVLEENTNGIYIVDQKTFGISGTTNLTDSNVSLTLGIQINETNAIQVTGSPNVESNTGNGHTPDDNSYYDFYFGTKPDYDLSLIELDIYPIQKVNTAVPIEGVLRNMGSETVTSFDINYNIDNANAVSSTVSSVSIASGETYDFTHTTDWITPGTDGNYVVAAWASNINGNPDEKPSNDTLDKSIMLAETFIERMPLHEVFTSSTCIPCKPGNIQLTSVLYNRPDKWTCVKYQMSWPGSGDPYYTAEGQARRVYYNNINTVPRLEVDGGWDQNPGIYTQDIFDSYYDIPSFIELEATHYIHTGKKEISVDLNIKAYSDFPSTTLRAHIIVVENITYKNEKTNGEYEFYNVVKKMLPNANGTGVGPFLKNESTTVSRTYRFKGNYRLPNNSYDPINHNIEHSVEDFANLKVVVFVQDAATKEILQSAWSIGTINTGTEKLDANGNGIKGIYPNPAQSYTSLYFALINNSNVSVDIYNSLGVKVQSIKQESYTQGNHKIDINTSEMVSGAYIAVLLIEGQSYTIKFIK